uniref:DUF148 domain-containing protein n=1 Tax=Meloidogyne hapla TaxID=6305 RepID=A0A1I8BSB6_MELHA
MMLLLILGAFALLPLLEGYTNQELRELFIGEPPEMNESSGLFEENVYFLEKNDQKKCQNDPLYGENNQLPMPLQVVVVYSSEKYGRDATDLKTFGKRLEKEEGWLKDFMIERKFKEKVKEIVDAHFNQKFEGDEELEKIDERLAEHLREEIEEKTEKETEEEMSEEEMGETHLVTEDKLELFETMVKAILSGMVGQKGKYTFELKKKV